MSSIKWKMAILYMLLVVVVMTGQGVLILVNLRANAYAEVYQKSEYTADRIIDMLSVQDLKENQGAESVFGEILSSLMIETINTDTDSGSESNVYLLDETGGLLYARKDLTEESTLASRAVITAISGDTLESLYVHTDTAEGISVGDYAVSFVLPQNDTVYIIFIRQSMETVQSNLRQTTRTILLVTLIGIVIAGFMGYLLAVSIADPIRELTKKTQELAEGNRLEALKEERPGEGISSGTDERISPEERDRKETAELSDEGRGDELEILEVNFDNMAGELTSSIRNLKAMEQMQKEFVANVSHELRTPVTMIRSYSETLLDSELDDPKLTRNFLEVIDHEANRMTALISDLLELSKMDAHQVKAAGKPVELGALLRQDLIDMTWDANVKHQTIGWSEDMVLDMDDSGEFPWPRGEFWIMAGSHRIDQVIRNLLTNAIKYSPEGASIRGGISLAEGVVSLWISDNGIGIAEKDQEKIFQRFYRVDKTRSRSMGGTGLGLAIVKETTELYGGTITLKSAVGKGSTFYLTFPEAPEVSSDEE